MQDANCLFCKIATHEIPGKIVLEDDRTIAFLDVHPRTAGHTVIVSKYHAPTLVELPDAEIGPLFATVKRAAGKVLTALTPAGLTIGVNHGAISGQTVPHLHVHIIPRYTGDGGGSLHSVVPNPRPVDIEEVAKKLGIA